ncbi:glycosyltransferase family 2 protein [Levilactobacillus namurensis]|uniref:glycosyltransferase family 2 protein n=1 Tax=Levilactobacillus namurensis TaxID=380393 RepID=UPI001D8D39C6|nr:glycosyltransferase family 2 protein [Levilactobacillus namurensis]HJE45710.1 glycosyltransferase [Levilactobacillus namurensis]
MEPLISIVVPVYNVEHYLLKCLDSLAKQTYKNIEVLLIDDGSTDDSKAICYKVVKDDTRFKYFYKVNGGLSDARNFGIDKSSGEYLTFVDSDDYVDRDYVSYLYGLLNGKKIKMSICQHRTVFTNGSVEHHLYNGAKVLSAKGTLERLLYSDGIDTSAWAKLYRSDIFESIRFPVGRLFEDIATTYKCIIESGYVAVGAEEKYNYIYRAQSIVNGKFNLGKLDLIEMTIVMGNDVVKTFPSLGKAVQRRIVYANLSTLNQMSQEKKYPIVKRKMIKVIRKKTFGILKDPQVPKRDKIALIILRINYPIYNLLWRCYLKVKKGI